MEKYKPVPFFFHGSGPKDLDPKHWFKIAFVSRPEGGEPESLHEPGPQCGGGGSQAIKISQLLGFRKRKRKKCFINQRMFFSIQNNNIPTSLAVNTSFF